jgi:hypothetical protein
MADLRVVKSGKKGGRDAHGRFLRGQSGNPAGRPRGCLDHANRAAQVLLAGEGAALTRRAIELALDGDPAAMRRSLTPRNCGIPMPAMPRRRTGMTGRGPICLRQRSSR